MTIVKITLTFLFGLALFGAMLLELSMRNF
jgi:hypothetical protein